MVLIDRFVGVSAHELVGQSVELEAASTRRPGNSEIDNVEARLQIASTQPPQNFA